MARTRKENIVEEAVVAPVEEHDNVADQLRKLGAELQSVATDKLARESKLKDIEKILGTLQLKDYQELAESPVVQNLVKLFSNADDLRPGEVKNKGTLAEVEREWRWDDLKRFKLIKFIPHETITLTFNGLQILVLADEECEIPECFYNIYKERQFALSQARKHEAWLMGISDELPHPNWQAPEGAVVRAWSTQGKRLGKMSGFLGTGPITVDEGEANNA